MKKVHPVILSLLGLGASLPIIVLWVLVIEPQVFGTMTDPGKQVGEIMTGVIGGFLALMVPTYLLVCQHRRQAASDAELTDAIETIPDAFVIYDSDSRLVICNRQFQAFYNYSEDEAAPGVTRSALSALDAARGVTVDGLGGDSYRARRRDFQMGPAGMQELQLADGREILARERRTANGGLVSVQTDISELKAVQAALAESERHLRDALENISDAFVYFDTQGRLVVCNENYRTLFGYTREEVAPGATRQQLGDIDDTRGLVGTAEVARTFRKDRRAQLTGGHQEMTFRMADGRWILSRARLMDAGVVSILTDVTDLKDAQARMEETEQLLRDAIESLDEGFVYFDADEKLVIANSRYKDIYPSLRDIGPGETFEEITRRALAAGEIISAEGWEEEWLSRRLEQHRQGLSSDEHRLADGRWVQVSERRTANGGSVGLWTDITALKESQMSAEAANRAKTDFLAHMSHELRTPLNSIIGFSEVLREQVFGALSPQYREYADHIHQSGVHLLTLINDILDISKVEVGEMHPAIEDVHVAGITRDCLSMMRPRAADKGLALRADVPEDLPVLRADSRHLKQVLINLLSNAIKFTSRGGQVDVIGELTNGGLRLSVTDNGIGIPIEDQGQLFEPFSRVENPESQAQDGTGLGLHLVKSITELNNGRVELTSVLGEGTTVTLSFPSDLLVDSAAAGPVS